MKLTQKQEKLALEIAHTLDDMPSIRLHRKFVTTYSEEYLRDKMQRALSVPENDVIVSRGAIYNSLVRDNGRYSRN